MIIHNNDIAEILNEIADHLEMEQANIFRVRAYRNAARVIQDLNKDVNKLVADGQKLSDLPGIGKDLSAQITKIAETGESSLLNQLRKRTPQGLSELMKIPGLGPKRIMKLYKEYKIHTITELARAAKDGRLHLLPGFGIKTEKALLDAISKHINSNNRFKISTAAEYAETLVTYLKKCSGASRIEVAGSFRRRKETVGDLDILIAARDSQSVIEHLLKFEGVIKVLAHGQTKASVVLKSKLQVDVRVVPHKHFGAALHYFTGSKAHSIAIRQIAHEKGLKVNEYGVFKKTTIVASETEQAVYAAIGLPYIEPELRENRGEIEAAQEGKLPHLIQLSDLRGDLHCHSTASDGRNNISEMSEKARNLGFEYIAITDHSKRLKIAHGLDEARLRRQIREIDKLNNEIEGITLLKGMEVDILPNGDLDMPADLLAQLDIVIGSVHSHFNLSREKQTARIVKAMENPFLNIVGHPSGRLIAQRQAYDVDMQTIIEHAKKNNCFLELNAHPERLDLLDIYCRIAKDKGVLVSINSDAHSIHDFSNLTYGIGQGRRGWLEKTDVLNTRKLADLIRLLHSRRTHKEKRTG